MKRGLIGLIGLIGLLMMTSGWQAAAATGWNGIYVWGGYLTGYSGAAAVQQSVQYALDRGFTTVRIAITPGEMQTEGISGQCATPSLACYAQIEFNAGVWDDPRLKRVILTTLDWSCYRYEAAHLNQGCLLASDLSNNQSAIEAEYTALFDVLKARFGSRAVEFIVDNWEGDNFAYCGAAYGFGQSASTAAACEATFPSSQTNAQRAAALVQWVGYRDQAAAAWRAANSGFDLLSALQFNALTLFCQGETSRADVCATETTGCHGYCNPSTDTVLDQVQAAGGRDVCDYSSYDSLNNNALPSDVVNILSRGCSRLILGEVGAQSLTADGSTPTLGQAIVTRQICVADDLTGVLGSVIWNLINPGSAPYWGLYDVHGAPLNVGAFGGTCLFPAPSTASFWK